MLKLRTIHKLYLKLILVGFLFISYGCEKEAGEGGTSSITGKVLITDYDNEGNFLGSYYGNDEDIYIIYGKNTGPYDDNYKTSYDGSYSFKYLNKGFYRIFAYSDCDSCLSGEEAVFLEIEITENKKEYVLEDLVIRK